MKGAARFLEGAVEVRNRGKRMNYGDWGAVPWKGSDEINVELAKKVLSRQENSKPMREYP
ncbi:hypothetical protein P5G51_002485 [Virgibacillus sp. 179-BFC.A HS]|uniref:Uncharacterized protein n=1 Tax=Tigheibacillus jepli TaxID=3035914 RepID=A0ABU5CDL9_9BACI|nr:hypothetical protein [Virgibacillus sp. 179-BFC.A HS]MDY0404432.1 hypothetical protein [Virgibacillus sp. 179-BFC.A HS]